MRSWWQGAVGSSSGKMATESRGRGGEGNGGVLATSYYLMFLRLRVAWRSQLGKVLKEEGKGQTFWSSL